MFVKRTRPEDKGNDFRFHPHNPEVSGSNPLPAIEKEPEYAILWFFVGRAYRGCSYFRIEGFKNEPLFARLKTTHINFVIKSY